ncbi:MAG: DUF3040 domain-containing protein [Haloechinothrix sp.]
MPLSEHEKRLLDQIEQALYAEDPKFASSVRGRRLGKPSRRKRIQGIALFVVGIALLPLGVILPLRIAEIPFVSVLGFLVMFFGVLLALTSLREPSDGEDGKGKGDVPDKQSRRSSFTQRMEERFRHRFDEQ